MQHKVISCEITLAHRENPFGRVISGRLTPEAFLVLAKYTDHSWFDDKCMDIDADSVKDDSIERLWCLALGRAPDNGMEADDLLNVMVCF
jgi:hypothetical protein